MATDAQNAMSGWNIAAAMVGYAALRQAGCSHSDAEVIMIRTVEWYAAHPTNPIQFEYTPGP